MTQTLCLNCARPARTEQCSRGWKASTIPISTLCAVTLGEIQAGIEITREKDAIRPAARDDWTDQVELAYNVLFMDAAISRLGAKLMHRKSSSLYEDAVIAACAIRHNITVVTRNIRDFKQFNLPPFNPFGS